MLRFHMQDLEKHTATYGIPVTIIFLDFLFVQQYSIFFFLESKIYEIIKIYIQDVPVC